MSATLAGFVATASGTGAGGLVLTKPSGVVSGDILVLLCEKDAGDLFNTLGGAWTELANVSGSGKARAAFAKVSNGAEAATETITINGVDAETCGWYCRITGAASTVTFDATVGINLGAATELIANTITTTVDNALLLTSFGYDGGDGGTFAINQGADTYTIVDQQNSGTGGGDVSGCLIVGTQDVAGDAPTLSVDSALSEGGSFFQIAIAPAATVANYSDVFAELGAQHHWDFDGDSLDQIGSANGTNTSVLFSGGALTEDATNCMTTNATTDRVSIPTTADINNSAQTIKVVAGWFETTAIQLPPKRIYGEGNDSNAFQFVFGFGNNVMFEVFESGSFSQQIYGPVLQPNRIYHLCGIFQGNDGANEIRFYVDGVEQTNADPFDRQPDNADLVARGVAEFGDPAGTVGIGGDVVLQNAPVNGNWQHWATWEGAVLLESNIRKELFERGALPDVTIDLDTEVNMQADLDTIASTTRPDAPLCIRVEALSGGGDFTLEADDIVFDELASIHVQYTGTDTLTWRNLGTSNASIGSTPEGGSIIFTKPVDIDVVCRDASSPATGVATARVYVTAAAGGPAVEDTLLINDTADGSGDLTFSYDYVGDQPVVGIARRGTSAPYYKTAVFAGTITEDGLTVTALLEPDE